MRRWGMAAHAEQGAAAVWEFSAAAGGRSQGKGGGVRGRNNRPHAPRRGQRRRTCGDPSRSCLGRTSTAAVSSIEKRILPAVRGGALGGGVAPREVPC